MDVLPLAPKNGRSSVHLNFPKNSGATSVRLRNVISKKFLKILEKKLKDVGGIVFLANLIDTKSQLVIKGRFVHF